MRWWRVNLRGGPLGGLMVAGENEEGVEEKVVGQ